jgi:hypothetical protein
VDHLCSLWSLCVSLLVCPGKCWFCLSVCAFCLLFLFVEFAFVVEVTLSVDRDFAAGPRFLSLVIAVHCLLTLFYLWPCWCCDLILSFWRFFLSFEVVYVAALGRCRCPVTLSLSIYFVFILSTQEFSWDRGCFVAGLRFWCFVDIDLVVLHSLVSAWSFRSRYVFCFL